MLILLPGYHARKGYDNFRLRAEVIKELGGQPKGPAPTFFGRCLGLVYEFPDHLFEEWAETIGIHKFV